MIIGVIFHGNMLAGGSFQQTISTIRTLSEEGITNKYIFYSPSHTNVQHVKSYGITTKVFKFGRKERLVHKLRKLRKLNYYFDKFHIFQPIDKYFENDNVDLIYFAGPSPICLFLERINYVFTICTNT